MLSIEHLKQNSCQNEKWPQAGQWLNSLRMQPEQPLLTASHHCALDDDARQAATHRCRGLIGQLPAGAG